MLVLHQLLYVLSMLRCTLYAFSGTNLLTRCRSASSCFLLFFVSEKLHRKYSRNWTKQKPKFLFHHNKDGVRRRVEDAPRGGHTRPRGWVMWSLQESTDLATSPIYSPYRENPRHPSIIPRKVPSRPS